MSDFKETMKADIVGADVQELGKMEKKNRSGGKGAS